MMESYLPADPTRTRAGRLLLARAFSLGGAILLFATLTWAYWPTFEQLVRRWSQDPQYTHGYIVPIFAAIVLWFRRDRFPSTDVRASWWAIPFLLLGGFLRIAGSTYSYEWLEAGSLIPSLIGAVLATGGPAVLRWGWPAGTFLFFVLPWPWQVDLWLTYPLRRMATVASTYALQTLGIPALARGNVITINELEVGVVEACSGLGMLMTFFALSTAVAFVIDRPRFDRILIFLSAIPVGVLMNVARITVTVYLYRIADAELARVIFHDVAGWVMMPLALFVLWLELLWLGRLWLPVEETGPVPVLTSPVPIPVPRGASRTPVAIERSARSAGPAHEVSWSCVGDSVSSDPSPLQEIPDAAH